MDQRLNTTRYHSTNATTLSKLDPAQRHQVASLLRAKKELTQVIQETGFSAVAEAFLHPTTGKANRVEGAVFTMGMNLAARYGLYETNQELAALGFASAL